MKLKICGMKLNAAEVASLRPDYLGFIFWEPSSRFFDDEIPELPEGTKIVGVFVDASIEIIIQKVDKYGLHAVQLHGKESPKFCAHLRTELKKRMVGGNMPVGHANVGETSLLDENPKIIKVISIKDNFDFRLLAPFEAFCDYYLFDTKGKLPGGNGYAFDWSVLENYPSNKPYFLSGGIGLKDAEAIKRFRKRPEAKYCYAVDVNSKFEIEPGLKDINKLKEFIKLL
ncbi:hypothetical protein LCGC14_1088600 [marine sediment metagenome]|uniref:N-(5'-phosphoribosyl)anthranilate isomerase n=2 Tax=root TaxID=1 RepID=A0A831VNN0_9FLAO|nr:phosphoribosylanthranilate isomerase [Pricia antarctica]